MVIKTMIESNDFLKFIKSRRSIKRLKPDPIPRKAIEEILDIAISAPSAPQRSTLALRYNRRSKG